MRLAHVSLSGCVVLMAGSNLFDFVQSRVEAPLWFDWYCGHFDRNAGVVASMAAAAHRHSDSLQHSSHSVCADGDCAMVCQRCRRAGHSSVTGDGRQEETKPAMAMTNRTSVMKQLSEQRACGDETASARVRSIDAMCLSSRPRVPIGDCDPCWADSMELSHRLLELSESRPMVSAIEYFRAAYSNTMVRVNEPVGMDEGVDAAVVVAVGAAAGVVAVIHSRVLLASILVLGCGSVFVFVSGYGRLMRSKRVAMEFVMRMPMAHHSHSLRYRWNRAVRPCQSEAVRLKTPSQNGNGDATVAAANVSLTRQQLKGQQPPMMKVC